MSTLTVLDLSSSQIDDQLTEAICKHLPNLTSLALSNNKITAQGATAIATLNRLTQLELSTERLIQTITQSTIEQSRRSASTCPT